jgi:hypothetical protein
MTIINLSSKSSAHFFVQWLIVFFSFSACKKNDVPEKSEILSFTIEAARNNEILTKDITGTIEGNKILLSVPRGVLLKNAYVTCKFKGEHLYVNYTLLDYTDRGLVIDSSTVFTVINKKGNLFDYTIVLNEYEDPELVFNSFSIEKSKNPGLRGDILFEIIGDTIYGSLDPDMHELIPALSTGAQDISVNAATLQDIPERIDFSREVTYTLTSSTGFRKAYFVKISWNKEVLIPHIYINTEGGVGINSKTNYVNAEITIDGRNVYNNYTGTTRIRGRGNSTWGYPKKPYRLKLDKKEALFGLSSEKDWVLLANYLDETHMMNAVAMKTGKLLEMPYTNNIIPVELTLNGEYKGLYMFTEQVEAEKNRVNVGDGGVLIELDKNFDEPWQFKSASYDLPVMLKYPDLTSDEELIPIRSEFEQMETLVAAPDFPNNNYLNYIDGSAVANYFVVYLLTDNKEINHPKSTFIYKTNTGKYTMGPIWDFDWAFGYDGATRHFSSYDSPLFVSSSSPGMLFFTRLLSDPQIQEMVRQQWADLNAHKLTDLLNFVDEYSELIEGARYYDYQLWKVGEADFASETTRLKTWLQNRASYLDKYIGSL